METKNIENQVLVTGGTGFVGAHCILQLLQMGYKVRTSVRSLSRRDDVLEMLRVGGVTTFENLEFVEADLMKDTNWDVAVKNCDYVLHVASPIYLRVPKDENEMILPAVNGTIRVLRAARDAGVKRVVLTSNFGAVGYSETDPVKLITEESWTNPDEKGLSAYLKSKVFAEKAAWNFMQTEGGDLQLSVINPVGIFGPSLSPDLSSGFELLKRLLDGSMRFVPNIPFGIVDIRDAADLHIRAMTNPMAAGERFLAVSGGVVTLPEIAVLLRESLGEVAKNVSTRKLPDWIVRIAALFNPLARNVAGQLGKNKNASNEKARTVLGWSPRTNEEAILASARSLVRFHLIDPFNKAK